MNNEQKNRMYDLDRMIELAAEQAYQGEGNWASYRDGYTAAWKERTDLIQLYSKQLETARETVKAQAEEIARLWAALESIVKLDKTDWYIYLEWFQQSVVDKIIDMATDALKGETPTE